MICAFLNSFSVVNCTWKKKMQDVAIETEHSVLHVVRVCVCMHACVRVRACTLTVTCGVCLLCFKGVSVVNNNNYKPPPNNGVQGRHMSPNMSPHQPPQQQAPPRQLSPPHSPASSQGSMMKVPSSPRHQAEQPRLSHEQVI